jgi:predicted nucleic acid-binding protein
MGVLIDTSIFIEAERGRLRIEPFVELRPDEQLFLSVVTVSELLHGVSRATTPERRARRSAFVESIIERFPILEIDAATARAHAAIWAELASNGCVIGPHDLWLAATCIAHGLAVATTNVREFVRVPGLQLETWIESLP